jgi:cation diffusion facilitator CzcD-associated flavoprotein CzcO
MSVLFPPSSAHPRSASPPDGSQRPLPAHTHVAVIGAGFAGLGTAIRLKQSRIEDFVVLERADDVGGTWRDNTYPGCTCDVPSHLYSFSFAPNPGWSRTFSPASEIWDYLRACAARYGIGPYLRLGCELTEASWDDHSRHWRLRTSRGSLTADVLVSGVGALSEPSIPELPGLERFEGTVFHSAHWDHEHELRGERVAVVGTGASAIQFVPQIQPQVARLHVFQRTPPWVMPRPDRAMRPGERRLYRRLPAAQRAMRGAIYWARETFAIGFMHPRVMRRIQRIAERHLREQVPDEQLRRRLTPEYRMGCKRVLISDDYLPALSEPNVEVVDCAVREVRERSVIGADGVAREVDTIIFGTGFHVSDMSFAERIRGRDGRTLAERWAGSQSAYRGTTVAGYPNLFLLLGPNTGLGHNSVVFMIEAQLAYVMDCLRLMREHGLASVDVRREVEDSYNEHVQERLKGTVWNAGGCRSWYLDANGRNSTLWPGFTWPFRRLTRRFDLASYAVSARPPSEALDPVDADAALVA